MYMYLLQIMSTVNVLPQQLELQRGKGQVIDGLVPCILKDNYYEMRIERRQDTMSIVMMML